MKTVCVYLGINSGNKKSYKEAVIKLGHEIVENGLTLVYGGSSLGMMGLLANTVKELGGSVIGVITTYLLEQEKPLKTLDKLFIVNSMQERKKKLQQLGDVFIVMPGGLGTLEEAFETWNAIKMGEINKKIGFLNIDEFYSNLFSFVSVCKDNGFINAEQAALPVIENNPSRLLSKLIGCKRSVEQSAPALSLVSFL